MYVYIYTLIHIHTTYFMNIACVYSLNIVGKNIYLDSYLLQFKQRAITQFIVSNFMYIFIYFTCRDLSLEIYRHLFVYKCLYIDIYIYSLYIHIYIYSLYIEIYFSIIVFIFYTAEWLSIRVLIAFMRAVQQKLRKLVNFLFLNKD